MVNCSVEARSSSRVCGEVCRNPSHDDARVRGTEPGIARKPIRPTPPVMRADRTRWAGWWRKRRLFRGEGKDLDGLPTPMVDPCSSQRATSYIHPQRRGKDAGLRFESGGWREQTTNSTDPARSVAFGAAGLALLA